MMNKLLCKFLSVVFVFVCMSFTSPAYATDKLSATAPDISDYGLWNTENNYNLLMSDVKQDVSSIADEIRSQSSDSFVPIEVKAGLGFINAFSHVADVLNDSFGRFVIIFISIMFALWLMLEAYNIMIGKDTFQKKIPSILKTAAAVAVWSVVLSIGPVRVFGFVMYPIMSIGAIMSQTVLDATSNFLGSSLPDVCGAINTYVSGAISTNNALDVQTVSGLLCVPSQLSGLCYTAISAGFDWMSYGIGNSAVAFFCGLFFIVGFIYLGWKFAFMAFGVVAELFIGIIMLPFTAIAEATKKTSYKGIAGDIYNGFLGLFKAEDLKTQINRLISIVVHFFVLSILIAICFMLLSGIIDTNTGSRIPELNDDITYVEIIIAALAFWIAKNAPKIAEEISGKINHKIGDDMEEYAAVVPKWGAKYAGKGAKKVAGYAAKGAVVAADKSITYLKGTTVVKYGGRLMRNGWNKGVGVVKGLWRKIWP